MNKTAGWIWNSKVNEVNQYVCFRKHFIGKDFSNSKSLRISANWDFILYLNGEEIGRNQFPDYPLDKTFTEYDISDKLNAENNVFAVLVYNPYEDFFAQLKAPGALYMELTGEKSEIITDSSWKCALHPAFHSGITSKVTGQLGFNCFCDLRKNTDWQACDFDDSTWSPAVEIDYCPELKKRPLKPFAVEKTLSGKLVKSAVFKRQSELETFALTVHSDVYKFDAPSPVNAALFFEKAPTGYDGLMGIWDLGAESVGYFELECTGGAGTQIDISWGEHLDDGVVRSYVGNRNFCDRIVLKSGVNYFELPFKRFGCRYLQLNITKLNEKLTINSIGLKLCNPNLSEPAKFNAFDEPAQKLRKIGLDTLRLCMHDHYEDCPWREQGLYAYDSRNQMLFGYYVWGNYDFAATSLELLGNGCGADGELNICAPTNRTLVIPIFSMIWMTELYENYLYSGKIDLLEKFAAQIIMMADRFYQNFDSKSGLFRMDKSNRRWNFCEWVDGLNGIEGCFGEGFQAPHNLYLYEMFVNAAKIMHAVKRPADGERFMAIAKALGPAIERNFFSAKHGCYLSENDNFERLHNHTQYLMLSNNLVPENKKAGIFAAVKSGKLIKETCSPWPYMLKGMFNLSVEAGRFATDSFDEVCLKMIQHGATSLYETPDGGDAFDKAGSLCHAWSAIHLYYYGAYVLGATPLEPGFRKFQLKINPGRFKQAEGEVPTPYGKISISWKLSAGNIIDLTVKHPANLEMVIADYPGYQTRIN